MERDFCVQGPGCSASPGNASNELGDAFETAQDRAGNRHDRQLAGARTGEGEELEQAQEVQEDREDVTLRLESARCVEMGDSAAQEAQEVQEAQQEVQEVQDHRRRHPPDRAALAHLERVQVALPHRREVPGR